MSPLHSLARPEILTLKPYSHAAWRPSLTRLHANEAPWRPSRRYSLRQGSIGIPSRSPKAWSGALPPSMAFPRKRCW